MDKVSMHINAPPERIYDLIADITQMGRWSPECTGGRWLKGATGPEVGARFRGSNRHGAMRWWTHCTVTRAERPTDFEFRVAESGMRWGYRLDRQGDGTVVTEYREHAKRVNPLIKLVQRSGLIGSDREDLMVDGMQETLERLKVAAEGASETV